MHCLVVGPDMGHFAETPMDGATKFVNFLAAVPWEEPAPEMMAEVNELLKNNCVTRVSHFSRLDVKNLKFTDEGNVPAGATLGFIQKAIKFYEQQYGSDDERVQAPKTPPNGADGHDDKSGGEARLELAFLSAMGKTRKVYENINLEELMESRGLDWFFPPEVRIFV